MRLPFVPRICSMLQPIQYDNDFLKRENGFDIMKCGKRLKTMKPTNLFKRCVDHIPLNRFSNKWNEILNPFSKRSKSGKIHPPNLDPCLNFPIINAKMEEIWSTLPVYNVG
jgi:hypothetical protein